MKKYFLFSFTVVCLFAACKKTIIYQNSTDQTDSLTIISPHSGDSLVYGAIDTVAWTTTVPMGAFSVYLIGGDLGPNGSKFLGTADVQKGNFSWVIPTDVGADSGYQLEFSNASLDMKGFSESFAIYAGPAKRSVGNNGIWTMVTYPNGGENISRGSTVHIQWKSSLVEGNVFIGYSYGPGSLNWIEFDGENTGSYDWVVPTNFTPGTRLLISVEANGVEDQSDDYFYVVN